MVGSHANAVGAVLRAMPIPNAHRILNAKGQRSAGFAFPVGQTDDPVELLKKVSDFRTAVSIPSSDGTQPTSNGSRRQSKGLTSTFSVELPGIEPVALPGLLLPELPVRSDSAQFSTTRYLRFRSRALTASRASAALVAAGVFVSATVYASSDRLICDERSKRSHPDPSHATVPR